jgi:hypothetical protein
MEEPKKFKVPNIKHDALITIEVSGAFLKRCQVLLISVSSALGPEKVAEAFKKFRDTQQEPSDLLEAALFTLTAIVGEVEKKAIEQNKVETVELTAEEASKIFNGS